ncbi:MAG: hypothetical protein OEZ39_02670 [Gammaproteobacteria bacterium]|nr:hypothetical protein [Gammaproteobacteria bacterium]MDH5650759.1 hypothetical protein [Gammaproteobacteria bacterium]
MATTDRQQELIWQSYAELGAMERHIHGIQARCRMLASVWLLAAFAGLGFVLSENLNVHIPNEFIITGISIGCLCGIFILWVLDQAVYHRQLCWIVAEAILLEEKHTWLPNLRIGKAEHPGNPNQPPQMIWFYIAKATILLLLGSLSLGTWLFKHHPDGLVGFMVFYILLMSLIINVMYIFTHRPVVHDALRRKSARRKPKLRVAN